MVHYAPPFFKPKQMKNYDGCYFVFYAMFFVPTLLKLAGLIKWSWWWVTLPFWLPTIIVVGMLAHAYFSKPKL